MVALSRNKRIFYTISLLLLTVLLIAATSACQEKVKVKTGSLRVCKYGEIIEDKTKTISVPKSEAAKYTVNKSIELCQKHAKIESLYRSALESVSSGEEEEALRVIEQAAKKDPALKPVLKEKDPKKQLDKMASVLQQEAKEGAKKIEQITNNTQGSQAAATQQTSTGQSGNQDQNSGTSSSAASDSGSSSSNTENNADVPKITDPKVLLPASILGYISGNMNWGEGWANRDYTPPKGRNVESLLIEVIVTDSAEKATERIDEVQRKLYPSDGSNVAVGKAPGYFGTNETNYASVAFTRNNALYSILILASNGAPGELKSEALSIASQIP